MVLSNKTIGNHRQQHFHFHLHVQLTVNKSIGKEINPEYSLEGLMLKLKLQYFDYLMQRTNSLEKILMLGKTEGMRRREQQRMRWLMASPTQLT